MLRKRVWIPIVSVFVIAMGCGLFYGRKVANQEPVKVYKPVEVSEKPATPKPPPPGETYETGHWHGDEWHANDAHAPVEVSEAEVFEPELPVAPPEVQGGSGTAPPIDAQIIEQAAEEGKVELFSERTPAYHEAVKKWQAWSNKQDELIEKYSQLDSALTKVLPTEAEAIRFENDENYKKELRRKWTEAYYKVADAHREMREHAEKGPPFPYIR